MRISFYKALWGMDGSLDQMLGLISRAGYQGIETPAFTASTKEIGNATQAHGLGYIAQAFPLSGDDLKQAVDEAVAGGASMLNVHSGKDWWDFERGCSYFQEVAAVQADSPIPVVHETHRGRLLFHPQITQRYLREFPDLRVTADFSHFTCVSESLLEDQEDALATIIEQTAYVHARVGHEEGPQVSDPSAYEWRVHLDAFETWWDRMIESMETRGMEQAVVVPEFGPPHYMPTLPHTNVPVADLWSVCLFMRDRLASRWSSRL